VLERTFIICVLWGVGGGGNEKVKKGCSYIVKENKQISQASLTATFGPIMKTQLYYIKQAKFIFPQHNP
jgi:hypothetical protein